MSGLTVLHYLTQWMWLSDSFVYGPISASRHRSIALSRMEVINPHVYTPPGDLHCLSTMESLRGPGGELLPEGLPTARAALSAIKDAGVDVVHLHHGYGLPDASAIASLLRVPLVVSFWGYDVTALPSEEPERVIPYLSQPDLVTVPSRFLKRTIEKLGVASPRIRVLPGSVDTRQFSLTPQPEEPRVAFVGRFVPKKGIDTLMAAWPEVRRAVPDAELTLLGYGDNRPPANPRAGVRVVAPDPDDPREQVRSLIRWCRVYVSPSKTGPDGDAESQHIGNLEAQASGRVVLTTDHGPIPEFVEDGVSGVVVPQGDARQLASAMVSLLRDRDLCRRIGHQARNKVERFDVSATAAATDALYEEIVRGGLAARHRLDAGGGVS